MLDLPGRAHGAALIATGSTAVSAVALLLNPAFWSAASLLCSGAFSVVAWVAARLDQNARARRADADAKLAEAIAESVAARLKAETMSGLLRAGLDKALADARREAPAVHARDVEATIRRFERRYLDDDDRDHEPGPVS